MKRWEYACEIYSSVSNPDRPMEKFLNRRGKEGWEVCSCEQDNGGSTYRLVFKREITK